MTPQQIEAMMMALEALELLTDTEQTFGALDYGDNAITALEEALAEHAMRKVQRLGQEIEQEPVAWIHIMDNTEGIRANGKGIISITQKRKHPFGKVGIDFDPSYPIKSTPLYAAPPQRTWVGLTDEDDIDWEEGGNLKDLVKAIEAKLKEKNT